MKFFAVCIALSCGIGMSAALADPINIADPSGGYYAMHVTSLHRYAADQKTFIQVPGSSSFSKAPDEADAALAFAWAKSIWADMLG